MPSKPSLQGCRNTVGPSSSVCSLKNDAGRLPRQQSRQLRLAGAEGQVPQVLAVEFQEIEGVQDRLCGLVAVQRIGAAQQALAG
jgi:hypothetical protein